MFATICFMRFRTYVLSRCYKSRSGAYVAMTIHVYMLQVWPRSAGWWPVAGADLL
jgi:hypothetical protein